MTDWLTAWLIVTEDDVWYKQMQPVTAAADDGEDEAIFATAEGLPSVVVPDEELGAVGGEGVYPLGIALASTAATYQVLLFIKYKNLSVYKTV